MDFVPQLRGDAQGERLLIPGLLKQRFRRGMGEVDFVHRIGGLSVRDAEQMPQPVVAVHETMVVDVPFRLFADAGVVDFDELARFDQFFLRRFRADGAAETKRLNTTANAILPFISVELLRCLCSIARAGCTGRRDACSTRYSLHQYLTEKLPGSRHLRVVQHQAGRAVLDDLPVGQHHDSIGGAAGEAHLVGDENQRQPVAFQRFEHRRALRFSTRDRARW